MDIGRRIAYKRKEKGLTQEELGQRCGASKQTIFKYETGIVTNIPLDKVEMIASALSVNPGYIMGWEEEKEKPALNEESGPPGYSMLTPANRAIVDRLIADLAASQSTD